MKKLLIGLALVVVLLIGAALALPFVLPVGTYVAALQNQVKQATGRDLAVQGPVRLSFLPRLEIEAEDVAFANAPGGAAPNMASLAKLTVALQVAPLLRGDIVVDRFVLVEPTIDLEIDEKGRGNWHFAGDEAAGAPGTRPGAGQGGLGDIRLGDIRIERGRVLYTDRRSGERHEFSDVNLKVALPSLDQAMRADGDLVWRGERVAIQKEIGAPRALLDGGQSPVRLAVTAKPIAFRFDGSVSGVRLDGTAAVEMPSFRDFAAWAGHPIQAPPNTFGPVAIAGKVAVDGARTTFSDATIAVDQIKAAGVLGVDTGGGKPHISGKLDVERLDLNPYLPPEKPGGRAGSASGGSAGWSDDPIDLAGLKGVDAELQMTAGSLQIRKIAVGRSALDLTLKDGRLVADLKELLLYDGRGRARVTLDGSAQVPRIAAQLEAADVQVEPLLRAAADYDRLSGRGALGFEIAGSGASQRAIVAALDGKGAMQLAQGSVKGLDLAGMLRNIGTAFGGSGGAQKTDFSELSGTFTIARGIVRNNDLAMKSPFLRIEGAGTVDLPRRSVDYRVLPKAVTSAQGQGGRNDAIGIMVPILVQGPWDNLSFKPDVGGAIRAIDPSRLLDALPGARSPSQPQQQPGSTAPSTSTPPAQRPLDILRGILPK